MAWKNRIIALEEHKAGDLLDHPLQFKNHPDKQGRVLRGILGDVGVTDALLAYKSPRAKNKLVKIDGHGRAGLDKNQVWPVLILDLTDKEADYIISLLDKSSEMAVYDDDLFARALESIDAKDDDVRAIVDEILDELEVTELVDFDEDGEGDGEKKPSKKRGGTAGLVRVALATDQLAVFERAIRSVGIPNRGDALIEICTEYMELRGIDE